MGQLDLALLGTPEVRVDGALVAFPTRKAAALLFYLATAGGRPSRAELAALLWPESDEERARGALRSTLGLLRRALGTEQSARLIGAGDRLGFAAGEGCALDCRALDAAYALARRADAATPERVIAQLRDAAARYRGDFLAGFSLSDAPDFDDWAARQREAWHRRADLVFDRLSQELFEGGEFAEARDVTARWVAVDPLNEAAHRRLMRVAFATGDRAGALRAYETCRATLRAELQASPAPETEALATRIRDEPPPEEPARRDDRPPIPLVTSDAPLVGRRVEHAELVAAFRAARQGAALAASIEGEAGIGKSRLAGEFRRWAAAQGAETLAGRAFEAGARLPYAPLIEALRERLAREADPRALLGATWLGELGRLLPELRDRLPDLPPPAAAGEAEARGRLFEALGQLGRALAARAPVVWLVDDLQWADSATRDALRYLARRWSDLRAPVLLVLAVRAEDLGTTPELVAWLDDLGRDLPLRRLGLGPLAAGEVAQLVRAGGAGDAAAAFARWLFAETGGQPLFLAETMKALFERGLLRLDPAGGQLLPPDAPPDDAAWRGYVAPGLRAVIRARLARLTPPARDLLAAGATLGDGCAFAPLARVADLGDSAALGALDEVLARRLLREVGGRYRFGHDRIREVVYEEAGGARRRIYHGRALAALDHPATPAAELARHALAADLPDPAFRHSVAAGDDALRLFATRDAIGHYERAAALLPHVAPPAGAVCHLHARHGWARELAADYPRARAAYEAMLAAARAARSPALECAALNRLANLAGLQVDLDRQAELLAAALVAAEASGEPAGLVETGLNLAQHSMFRSDFAAMRRHGLRGAALAREHGLREPLARVLDWLALAEVICGNWWAARDHAAEARAINAARGDRAAEGGNLTELAGALVRLGETRAGIDAARTALAIAAESGHGMALASTAKELALGLFDTGEWGEALTVAERGLAAARDAGYPPMLAMVLAVAGRLHRQAGAPERALALHDEAWAILAALGSTPLSELIASERCCDCAAAGDWPAAADWACRALALRDYATLFLGLDRHYEVEALLRAGEADRAAADLERFGAKIGMNRRYRLAHRRAQAVLAAGRGDHAAAIPHLQEAARIAATLELPGEAWSIAAELGAAWRRQGDAEEARRAFAEAEAGVRALAARLPDDAARDRFLAWEPVRRARAG